MTHTTEQPGALAPGAAAVPVSDPGDAPTARPGRAVVPVLAFAGITVAVAQTLLVPVIKDLPTLLATSGQRHLGDDGHPVGWSLTGLPSGPGTLTFSTPGHVPAALPHQEGSATGPLHVTLEPEVASGVAEEEAVRV